MLIELLGVHTSAIRRSGACLTLFASALALAGCGRDDIDRVKTFPAEGRVLWEGQPLAGALVVLHPLGATDAKALPARAETDADGRFQLGTYDSEDGAPAGEYAVTVAWHPLQRDGESFEPGPNVVPPRYSDLETTELRVRITEGKNEISPLTLRR